VSVNLFSSALSLMEMPLSELFELLNDMKAVSDEIKNSGGE